MKRKRAHMEMVDWALEIIALEVLLLLMLEDFNEEEDGGGGGGSGEDEDDEGEEEGEEKRWFSLTMGWLSSSGKKTRNKPMPQFSLLLLPVLQAESPIFLSHSRALLNLLAFFGRGRMRLRE